MNTARLQEMLANAVGFDTETHMIQPGLLAPPLVCASIAEWDSGQGRIVGALLDKQRARDAFVSLLAGHYTIVGANIAYDMLVMANDAARRGVDLMPEIFAAYEEGRVFDLQIAEALHAVATGYLGKDPRTSGDPSNASPLKDPITNKRGRYSLSICTDLVLGRRDAKANDRFRNSYALLEDTPLDEWPPEARIYPVDDACNTLEVALAQVGHIARPGTMNTHTWPTQGAQRCTTCGISFSFNTASLPPCKPRPVVNYNLQNLAAQAYAAFAMHLGAAWGFAIDPDAVDELEKRIRANREKDLKVFLELGYLRLKREPNHKLDAAETSVVRAATAGTELTEPQRLVLADLLKRGVLKPSKNTAVIKRASAIAYGCKGACPVCQGTQKVKSAKSGNPVGCRACDSTGLNLDSAPVPRTKGSKCRTCKSTRIVGTGACANCAGQPDVIPGCGTSRDALSESGEEALINFAAFSEEAKILETYIPFLRKGISEVPDDDEEDEEDE